VSKREVRRVYLSTFAEFSIGMATAWAFAFYLALIALSWWDLLSSLSLAILSLLLTISLKLKTYDKYS
jgi:hypothetical protein